jgi:AraC-like DNA-binding protein
MSKTGLSLLEPLGEALQFLRTSETTYYYSELTAPWALVMPQNCPKFHFVTSGGCWLEVEGTEDRLLEPGDFAVVPHGSGHRLSSDPSAASLNPSDLKCERVTRRYAVFRHGGGGTLTTIICGDLNFTHPAAGHLIALLPKIICVRANCNRSVDWIHSTIKYMSTEAQELRPGGEAVITHLTDILMIEAIRSWIAQYPEQQIGWLAALQDKRISRAISLIHGEPEKAWTVELLASAVGMSRSSFSARFTDLVGESVMQYVARWRMHLALVHLKEGAKNVEEIAVEVGYSSAAAFSRAFKRTRGAPPGSVRNELSNHAN